MTDIVTILDVETLGLDRMAPVWEFAGVRLEDGVEVERDLFQIRHDVSFWLDPDVANPLPAEFVKDYRARYDEETAVWEHDAAKRIDTITDGAKVIGCNPGFDLERLNLILYRSGRKPSWHYHPLDITSLALGYAACRDGRPPAGPWRSEQMASLVGVEAADYARHTALGDVEWTLAQWRAVMGTEANR